MLHIPQEKYEQVRAVAERHGLKLVLLFGSQVEGRTHAESDIDIAVLPEKTLTWDEEYRLMGEFVKVFGDRMDFTNIRLAAPQVLRQMIDHCVVLYAKDELMLPRLEAYVLQRYAEMKPIFDMRDASLQRFIHEYDQSKIRQGAIGLHQNVPAAS